MIVPAFMLELERAGLGTLKKSESEATPTLYWEELPQKPDVEGVWVVSDGDAGSDESAERIQLTIYARSSNKLWSQIWLDNITRWVRGDAQELCELTVNPYELSGSASEFSDYNRNYRYDIVAIRHTGDTQTQELDQNGRLIKSITITIKYNEREDS